MIPISARNWWLSHAIALCGIIPLFHWLDTAPRIAVVGGFLTSFWQQRTAARPLKNWLLNAAIIPVFLIYLLQYRSSNAVQPVVSALAFMLALRLLSAKSVRHQLQIHALALFCLASSSLFDLSPIFLIFLTLLLFLEAPALVLLTYQAADERMQLDNSELRSVVAAGAALPLLSLPLLLLFFPILPRTPLPLWNFMSVPAALTTGFSEKVEPGAAAQQLSAREPVFRAEMRPLPFQQRYWRVTVFNHFDGTRWLRSPLSRAEHTSGQPGSIAQTIYLEPGSMRYLPLLDRPVSVSGTPFQKSPDDVYQRSGKAGVRLVYRASSATSGSIPSTAAGDRRAYLQLPPEVPASIRRLSQQLLHQTADDTRRMELLERYFRAGGYRYSRQGMPTGQDALEQFLFSRKQGNCEYFASAYALLLRAAGVPTRLVGGYLGGEYNEVGGYYLISEDLAHVWVEVLISGRGWLRVDPSSYAGNAGQLWGAVDQTGALQRIRHLADAVDYYWNRAVVTYDFGRQVETIHSITARLHRLEGKRALREVLPYLLVLALLAGSGYLWRVRPGLFTARERRILRQYYDRLENDCKMRIEPGKAGVFELAALSNSDQAQEFARIYGAAIYHGRRLTDSEYRQLEALCRAPFSRNKASVPG